MGALMDQYRWKKRPLLVFAPSPEDARYRAQVDSLSQVGEGLADRDMVVIHCLARADAEGRYAFVETDAGGSFQRHLLEQRAQTELRDRYGDPGFQVILVGKDGGVKLRSDQPVAVPRLFSFIDSMPMRRREMQE